MENKKEITRGLSVGLVLPKHLACFIPDKAEDPSDPHVTLIYIPNVGQSQMEALCNKVEAYFANIKPFTVMLTGEIGYFDNVSYTSAARLAWLKAQFDIDAQNLVNGLANATNFNLEYPDGNGMDKFTPHVTVEYIQKPDTIYHGPTMKAMWKAEQVTVWYGDDVVNSFNMLKKEE